MTCYYFDIEDGVPMVPDDYGTELASRELARAEAVAVLHHLAKETADDCEHRRFVATARDENGKAIYRATLTFDGEWLG